MKKIFALFVAAFVIAACTDPFDATSIWDKLNEIENKIDGTDGDIDTNAVWEKLNELESKINKIEGNDKDPEDGDNGVGSSGSTNDDSVWEKLTELENKITQLEGSNENAGNTNDGTEKPEDTNISSIWDRLTELENKINEIENNMGGSAGTPNETANNKIYYTTSDGKKLFPNNIEPAAFGAILVSNIYENGVGVLTFDDDITSIPSNAFHNYDGLTSITIPNSVTSIGSGAFYQCFGLKEVHINDLAAWCNIDFEKYDANPLCYALNLYLNNELITELVIPNGVTSIKKHAFENSYLNSVVIPNSVTSIGERAFEGCFSLTSITIPNSVTSIGNDAFSSCYYLNEVHITDLDAWKNISFGNSSNPLDNNEAKLYLNGVEVTDY